VQVAQTEGVEPDLHCSVLAADRRELERRAHARRVAQGRQHAQPLARDTAQREREDGSGGRVQPLQVVEGDHHVAGLAQRGQHVEQREADRLRLRRLVTGRFQQQRDAQRPRARLRQRVGDLIQNGRDEVDETAERERRLGLHRAMHQHAPPERPRLLHGRLPQDGLADSRLAPEHEGPRVPTREEAA
jgi:hypothetical protein